MADRKRKRQTDGEGRTLARRRLHVERPAQALDLGRNDVHADAAAGLLSDEAGGGEAGLENELHRILIAQRLLRADEAERDALVANRPQVHAAAVVGETYQNFR